MPRAAAPPVDALQSGRTSHVAHCASDVARQMSHVRCRTPLRAASRGVVSRPPHRHYFTANSVAYMNSLNA
ncbi:hypothetical protein BOC39_11615 [Burkholderia pseudomallei]|nr:hypothetical protein BOC39_11615 [Burkholderia pseudomallei]ARL93329.1 hypothetical protein BOC58_10345 [Burkholderia pseudomallei]NRE51740.1 hypothetical protein [Burkholderia pseudomallei]